MAMATWAYVARDPAGTRQQGTLAAATEQAALAELQGRALAPVRVRRLRQMPRLRRRVSARRLATAYRQLADLLRVGMPLLKALQLLGRGKSNPRLAAAMAELADDIARGERLADSMAAHPDVFPSIQVAMVRAGERGAFLEHQADIRARVLGNLIYPCVLLVVGAGIVVTALVVFVPKFQAFYSRIELPLPTKILLGTSALLTKYWLLLLIGAPLAVIGGLRLLRRPAARLALARWQLRVPKLGPLVASLAVARFTRIMGTLLANGVPILSAMQISRDAAGHPILAAAIDDATEAVRKGEPLAKPLGASGLFPEDVAEMIAVGESANNLAEVLVAIADTIEKRIDRMLQVFVRLMEPLLLVALAGVVLFIFVALIVPMLRLSSAVGK